MLFVGWAVGRCWPIAECQGWRWNIINWPDTLPKLNMVHLKMAPKGIGDSELGHHFQVNHVKLGECKSECQFRPSHVSFCGGAFGAKLAPVDIWAITTCYIFSPINRLYVRCLPAVACFLKMAQVSVSFGTAFSVWLGLPSPLGVGLEAWFTLEAHEVSQVMDMICS